MAPTEQLGYNSSLVGRVLATHSMPGKTSLVHSLAAIVTDYTEENLVATSADVAQVPRETLAPRAQEVVNATTESKERGWPQHVRVAARKWSRPSVKLAARPKTAPKSHPKAKPKPAVRRQPGALRTALVATAATTAATLHEDVPLMRTQEDFNRFGIKVAPGGSLRGSTFHAARTLSTWSPAPCG